MSDRKYRVLYEHDPTTCHYAGTRCPHTRRINISEAVGLAEAEGLFAVMDDAREILEVRCRKAKE